MDNKTETPKAPLEAQAIVETLEDYFAEHPGFEMTSFALAEETDLPWPAMFGPLQSFQASNHVNSRREEGRVFYYLTPRGHEFAVKQRDDRIARAEADAARFETEKQEEAERERRKLLRQNRR